MKLLEKFEMSMTDPNLITDLSESSIDVLVNVNTKGAILEAAEEEEEETDEEETKSEKDTKAKKDKEECEDEEDCEDEEIEEIEEAVTLKTLPEMIDENMQITLYSLNEDMTEVIEEKVDFIVTEEAEAEEPMTDTEVEKEMEKTPKRPLKFLLLDTAKNTKINRLKAVGKAKGCLVKMAKKSTKLDHIKYLEKDRDTTVKVLKTKKDTLDSYGIQAKVQRFIDWLEGDYKDLLNAKRAEIIATSKKKKDKEESVEENFLAKIYSYDEEANLLVESVAIINNDDIAELQESGKYLSKTMAVLEANLSEKIDSAVANMKSTIAKADKYKLEKMQRDLPVTIAKTNVKKQKALKKGLAEKAKEYDRLLNYLRSGAPNDIKARIRTVQVVKEALELGIELNIPVVEQAEDAWLEKSLEESEINDAISVMLQYQALDNDGDEDITDEEVDAMPNEIAGEENSGTEGFHPESMPTIKLDEACAKEQAVECTGEDDCECTDCAEFRNRKKAIKEAKCKK